jgi:gamma-glutamylcyclotransferase (GGCT)/AIG2-like uncharacterized protein YtfP
MAAAKPFNLFVYGTLMNPSVFRAVLGRRFVLIASDADGNETVLARDAILHGYKKISPDNTYLYAMPDPNTWVRGYLIGPLPPQCMAALRGYEGRNYSRKAVRVQTAGGMEKAFAFVANVKELQHSFGYEFHDPFKQEVLLRGKIDSALRETEQEQMGSADPLTRRAIAELHGPTVRDLLRRHFNSGGISDYAIRHSLKDPPLRDFSRASGDAEAGSLALNYLALAIRQVVFNEVEERVHQDFRYELDGMDPGEEFYDRALSCLAALRMLNARGEQLNSLTARCLDELSFRENRLVDYVRWAISAADDLYQAHIAREEVNTIKTYMGHSVVPMGAELEFSNIGHGVILDPEGKKIRDEQYDGFLCFNDFALDVLTWKLGGHVDDHHVKSSTRPRRGFFETALGSLSIEAGLSKPVTDDPWVLNELIHQTRRFYPVLPHSLHISLQVRSRRRPVQDRLLPAGVMQCLFAIAGDPVRREDGSWKINRLVTEKIIREDVTPHMLFSEISLRHSIDSEDTVAMIGSLRGKGRYVQQFKFLRLSPHINYEPIAMALAGLQMSLAPGTFMTATQYLASRRHRGLYHDLIDWGGRPRPIGHREMETFLGYVYDGLMLARAGRAQFNQAYIAWALSQLRDMLREFNAMVEPPAALEDPCKVNSAP